ncbi:Sialin [Operophtera brumata]|uniref:Sialin n=1 Tax=Operophtera brumata TaxID=104452 RepID=A0A0L7KRR1_OPEBR|nr:Sialin [Operophtera brumata]
MAVPWRAALSSPAFLAILVSHACSNWGWYMLLIELPFYMKQVLKFNMTEKMAVPWRAALSSPAFLAILVSHACSNCGWYMLLIELPFYMKQVLKFNMTENAVTTALPFLSLWIFSIGLSKTLDWLRGKHVITTTTARKVGTLFEIIVYSLFGSGEEQPWNRVEEKRESIETEPLNKANNGDKTHD